MYSLKPIKSNNQILTKEYDFTIDKTIPNVSDNYVNFKNDPSISNQQATFSCQPMLTYLEAKFLTKLRLKVSASRTMSKSVYDTITPANNKIQTPPYILSCDNYTVPIGAINNLLTKLQINTGEETYVHENNNSVQRQVETLINFMQYDQKKLNEKFGLHLDKDIDPFLDYSVAFGNGVLAQASNAQAVMKSNANVYGYKAMLFERYKWILERNSKYCILDREAQTNASSYSGTTLPTISLTGINGYGEFSNMSDLDGVLVTQTAYIDVYEYIMAPFLSTDYKDKQMDKVLTTGNNVMNVSMNFDTNYLKNMVKCSSEITINSIDIDSIELQDMHLFSSQEYKQSLINRYEHKNQSLSYTHDVSYTPDIKVSNVTIDSVTPTKTTVSFTKSSQNTLSRFYLLACPLNVTQNNVKQKANNVKDIIFSKISNLRFEVTGSKTQYVLQNFSDEELKKMTSEALQNDDFWLKYLDKKNCATEHLIYPLQSGLYNSIETDVNMYNGNSDRVYNLLGSGWSAQRNQHLSFYILDLEKLSLGTIGGVPISPGVLYTDRFAVKFTYDIDNSINIYDFPQMMINLNTVQTYIANPLCIPITLNIGRINSSKQYELIPDQMLSSEYTEKYNNLLDNASYRITAKNLQFGGGFFGDLWNDIKNVASTVGSVAEHVVPIIDKVAGKKYKRSI